MTGRLTGVLFDFDGTLADTIPLILASFRHTFSELEPELDEATFRSWIGRPLIDPLEERHPGRGQELVARYREHNLAHHDALVEAVPGIDAMVDSLVDAGVPVGVVSSKRAETVRRGLRIVGLPDLDVVGLDEVARHKPHPDPLLEGARRLGLEPSGCAYVGDAVVDVQAARAAGMTAVAVTWGAGGRADLEAAGADAVVADAAQLGELLHHLTGVDPATVGGST